MSVNAKIPTALRQNFLDSFIDEYLKFCTAEDAYKKVCHICDVDIYTKDKLHVVKFSCKYVYI